MSKSKLDLATIVPVEASVPDVAVAKQPPYALEIFGPLQTALQQAAIHIRQGYTPSIDLPIDAWSAPGYIKMTLVRGNPDEAFVAAAEEAVANAAELEAAQYRKDVEREAARQIQAKADAEMAAKKALLIAEQKRQLADLEKQIASLTAATAQ